MLKTGYEEAIRIGREKLAGLDPKIICERTASKYENGQYTVRWTGQWRALMEGNAAEQIVWLHYLTAEGAKKPTGKLIAYREIPGAAFYEPVFMKRASRPIVKRFGNNPAGLLKAGEPFGGTPAEYGDCAVAIPVLPYVPVTYIVWRGDGELPAEASVLFDESAKGWLCAEDLAVLASLGAYALVKFQ